MRLVQHGAVDSGSDHCTQFCASRLGCQRCEGARHGQRNALDDPGHGYQCCWARALYLFASSGECRSMLKLSQQASASQRQMSALRSGLKRPEGYLAAVAVFMILLGGDLMRQPSKQVSARAYLQAVRGYQTFGRPLSARFIQCRYRQTCSRYSAEAVERFGLARGLNLTFRRLLSCRKSAVEQTMAR